MVVGVCRLVLALPGNDSLKGKRAVVKSIVERARVRFHVAAAEVADLDAHRRATLGFAYVSNDARHARSVLDKLVSFVASAGTAQVIDRELSVEHFEAGGFGGLSPFDGDFTADDPEDDDDDVSDGDQEKE